MMLSKNNINEQRRRDVRATSKSRYAFKKVSKGVASVLVGFTLSGQVMPAAVSLVQANEIVAEATEGITVERFQLTHIGNNDGIFSNRVGAQIELSIDQELSDGDVIALDIYQDSDAYTNGDVDQVRRFNVDTETVVSVNDGNEDIVVGTYDGHVITFNESIEDMEDVVLTIHLGTIVEPSYVYYYETVQEPYTEVVPRPIRTVYDANMSADDEPEILINGSDGERTITEEVTYRLGEEVDGTRRVISNEVTTEPEEQVVAVGIETLDGDIEVPEDPFSDLEIEESNPTEAEDLYESDGLTEAEMIEAYNSRGVNHTYHVHVNGEPLATAAIGFTTPSSMEIRNERAQDTNDVTGQYAIRENGRIHTQLTFADVFAVASEDDAFDGTETLRVEIQAEDGHRFSQNQQVAGHVLELTDAAYETEDGVEGSDVIIEPNVNRLQTDARVAELDVNVRYVDNNTLIADIALGDVDVAELGDRLLVLDGIRSTLTGDAEDIADDYVDILSDIDANTTVRASYGTTGTGFRQLFSVTAPGADSAVGYVFDSVNTFGFGTLVEDTIEIVSESYEEAIPFETVEIEDDTLPEGERVVETEGVDGVAWVTENVTYVNGEETERVEASREVLDEPVMEVIRVGVAVEAEEPVDEEPVDEEPVDEEPVDEEPVDEEPVDEEPVDVGDIIDAIEDPEDENVRVVGEGPYRHEVRYIDTGGNIINTIIYMGDHMDEFYAERQTIDGYTFVEFGGNLDDEGKGMIAMNHRISLVVYAENEIPADEEPVDEEPVDEEPVDEEPVDEEPVDEEPVDEEPVDEEPVDEEPVDEEPVDEEPVDEEPVDEEPVDEEPVDEEPVDEEPVDEEPVDEEPVDEEPVDEEPVDEEPVDEEPVDEEPVDEDDIIDAIVDEDVDEDGDEAVVEAVRGATDTRDWTVARGTDGVINAVVTPDGDTVAVDELTDDERVAVEAATGEVLPATATSIPTILALGASLFSVGGGLAFWHKKKSDASDE